MFVSPDFQTFCHTAGSRRTSDVAAGSDGTPRTAPRVGV
jgi:hypothetical protein